MAAKSPTKEQARMFHMAQIGHPDCFAGCCLHSALARAEEAETKLAHFERFKLYLEIMGGLDLEDAWSASEDMSEIERRELCTCGFQDFEDPLVHHPTCAHRKEKELEDIVDIEIEEDPGGHAEAALEEIESGD